ncbi:hypothetical protein TNCV_1994531 [Trichonephila clavipes]|nr:hypothetical protein TNCV_1994531 [Trichonephila clavipes]
MKIKDKQVWIVPPDHRGISRKSPGGALEFDGNRNDQMALSRLLSGHSKGMTFESGQKSLKIHSVNISKYMKKTNRRKITKRKKTPHVFLKRRRSSGLKKRGQFSKRDPISKENQEIAGHVPLQGASRKRCVYCKSKSMPTRTFWSCKGCGNYLCNKKDTTETCFQKFHSNLNVFEPQEQNAEEIVPEVVYDCEQNAPVVAHENITDIEQISEDNVQHAHVRGKSRRKCVSCLANGKITRTAYECKACKQPLCFRASGVSCFKLYHSQLFLWDEAPCSASPDLDFAQVECVLEEYDSDVQPIAEGNQLQKGYF